MRLEQINLPQMGSRKRTPVLFVHGEHHGAWCWQYWQNWFSGQGRPNIAISLRGHAGSEGRDQLDAFTLDDYVDDVIRSADSMSESPVLIGHSMGGVIAQKALAKYPDAFRAVILPASMPPYGMTTSARMNLLMRPRGVMALKHLQEGSSLSDKEVERLPFLDNRLTEDTLTLCREHLQRESKAALEELAGIALPEPKGALPPVLVIGSTKDPLTGKSALTKTADFYRASLIIYDEGCHDLMLDPVRDQIAREVECWLLDRKI